MIDMCVLDEFFLSFYLFLLKFKRNLNYVGEVSLERTQQSPDSNLIRSRFVKIILQWSHIPPLEEENHRLKFAVFF